ncbi:MULTISPECIES: hypothetical protein [unclassified Phenylobacterium]|nr:MULTISPECIES: hypothetical protein [unclassified Phenylobacterium]
MINILAMVLLVIPMIALGVVCIVLAARAKRDEARIRPRLEPRP